MLIPTLAPATKVRKNPTKLFIAASRPADASASDTDTEPVNAFLF
jgi:hypothetical protein